VLSPCWVGWRMRFNLAECGRESGCRGTGTTAVRGRVERGQYSTATDVCMHWLVEWGGGARPVLFFSFFAGCWLTDHNGQPRGGKKEQLAAGH
jgi:hypothetical protein